MQRFWQIVVVALLCCSSCRQPEKHVVTYVFQEERALVSITGAEGKTAYLIVNPEMEVVNYIHLTDVRLDTIFRDGKLMFERIDSGERGYIDREGKVHQWVEMETKEADVLVPSEVVSSVAPKVNIIGTNDWKDVVEQSPFYEEARKTFGSGIDEADANRRTMILDYVEQLRQSYASKDIGFIQQVFSDKALIITGKVIREVPSEGNHFLSAEQVVYNLRNKEQYLAKLRQIFAANQRISLQFSDFKINRHPTIPTIYGVSLRQGYTSDSYSDDGYLFLLWDFSNNDAPQIHVRTWQPRMLDDHTVIPENEIFSLRNFNLK